MAKESGKKGSGDIVLDMEDRHYLFSCVKMSTFDKICIFFAELIGTGLLVFIGCASCVGWSGSVANMYASLGFGFTVFLIVHIFGLVSGAHINPAVTIAAAIYKVTPLPVVPIYIIAQCVGSFLGFGLLKLMTPINIFSPEGSVGPGLCTTAPAPDVSVMQAIITEFFATMGLILACCSVWDPRNSKYSEANSIKLGITVFVLCMAFGQYSGCSMNPARSLGPAIWNNDWEHHWIYWLAPILSAVVSSILYKCLFWRESPRNINPEDQSLVK